jgi:hypothetical protein
MCADLGEEQYLYGQSPKLSKADLVSFATHVTKAAIKDFPEEFSDFSSVKVYIRPEADVVGGVPSPQGFSLMAAATFCGKQTDIAACMLHFDILDSCTNWVLAIHGRQIFVTGSVKALELGQLKLQGLEKSDAVIHAEISSSKQYTDISGRTKIYDFESAVLAELNPADAPKFNFHTYVSSLDSLSIN